MKQIPLTQGKFAIVDDEDFEYLSRFSWTYAEIKGLTRVYRNIKFFRGRANICMEDFIVNRPYGYQVLFHKNGDRLDFQKKNIGFMVVEAVRHNGRKVSGKYSSDYKGIAKNNRGKAWRAQIEKGKRGELGHILFVKTFDTENEAAKWWNKKAREIYGDNAYQNVIIEESKS